MTQMLFILRFKAQLRRTRPELVSALEKSAAAAIESSGGTLLPGEKALAASFDETALAFWLDILTLLETLLTIFEGASPELYGHVCVIDQDLSEDFFLGLPRMLPSTSGGTGIWCGPSVRKALEWYAVFDDPLSGEDGFFGEAIGGYSQLRRVKTPEESRPKKRGPSTKKLQRFLKQESRRNAVLLGTSFLGKRASLYQFCVQRLQDFPPLVVRFGSGGGGISCLTDSLVPEIRSRLNADPPVLKELDALGAYIFRERLRDELPDYSYQRVRRFLSLLLDAYMAAAERNKVTPLLILENIHEAHRTAGRVFLDVYQALPHDRPLIVYGTCAGEDSLEFWKTLFPRVLLIPSGASPAAGKFKMPRELWEIAYICELLRPYFPGFLFPRLIEEAGKSPAMISRAIGLLSQIGIIDMTADPRPRVHNFMEEADKILGPRKDRIRLLVRSRLLDWVAARRLRPCFNLLKALVDLGGESTDELIMDALYGDITNRTCAGIERAIEQKTLGSIVGMNRVPVLIYIFKTFKALIHGDEPEIRRAFQEPYPEETAFPGYKAQILTNFASYSLGARDVPAASEAVKESILTYQKYRGLRGLARSYRLFSLVNLYRQNLSDAIDYFAFAVENAEKHDDPGELAVINYYAAGAYFLFGNLSKAEWFAAAAEQTAMDAGRPEWADRAGFLRGRCRFESGRYKEALKIFEVLRKNPAKSLSPEAEQVLAAWIYRTNVFLRTPAVRPPGEMNGDALFFEVEASYLAEDYQKTANLAGRLPGKLSGERFLFIEQPDWHSGFAQCELLLFPQRVFWDRMVSTYHALALSRLGHVHGAEREQAARVMERIMRNERLPDTDPNDSFYCYSYYRVLRDYGAAEVDINTAVSMAFKRLQRRAGRIDDPETKRAYLSLPYWNGALSLAARDHKLI